MSLANSTDLFYSKKEREVIAKLQREKDAGDAANIETMSTASTLAPAASPFTGAPTPCGNPHSQNRPCDSPICRAAGKPSAGQRFAAKLGLGRKDKSDGVSAAAPVDSKALEIAEARAKLDAMTEEEKEKLRAEIRARPTRECAGVAGAQGFMGCFSSA